MLVTDPIFGRGLIAAETIAQELRERLARELTSHRWNYSDGELLAIARNLLEEFEPLLARNLAATDLAAWIAGADRLAGTIPLFLLPHIGHDWGLPPLPPDRILTGAFGDDEPTVRFPKLEKAAKFLADKAIVSASEFERLTQDAKSRAFVAGSEASRATMESIRDALAEDVAQGTSLKGFRNRLRERIDTSAMGPGQLERTYRTNVQQSFGQAQEDLASHPIVRDVFPYAQYDAIHDYRARPEHRAMEKYGLDGTNIYRADDPVWRLFTPPWGFNCRCAKTFITIESAARKGVKEAKRWLETGHAPLAPEWRLNAIPFRPEATYTQRVKVAA